MILWCDWQALSVRQDGSGSQPEEPGTFQFLTTERLDRYCRTVYRRLYKLDEDEEGLTSGTMTKCLCKSLHDTAGYIGQLDNDQGPIEVEKCDITSSGCLRWDLAPPSHC